MSQRTGSTLTWNFLRNCGQFPCLGGESGRGTSDGGVTLLGAFSTLGESAGKTVSASSSDHAHGVPRQCRNIHPCPVVDKTFTNSVREKCGHLYCCVVKLDISGAIGVHESQKEVKIQMDINVH